MFHPFKNTSTIRAPPHLAAWDVHAARRTGTPPRKLGIAQKAAVGDSLTVKHEDITSRFCFFVSKDVDFANSLVEENDGN
jgi:hypothetical protein